MTLNHAEKRVVDALHVACVRGILSHYAHHLHLLVSYGAVADTVKHAIRGRGLAEILAIIAEEDHQDKRPLSTAVVVNAETEKPGSGFFDQARSLGISVERTPEAEESFWTNQLLLLQVKPFTLKSLVEGQESGHLDIPFVVPAQGAPLPLNYVERIHANARERGVSPNIRMPPTRTQLEDMDEEIQSGLATKASQLPGDFVTRASSDPTQVNDLLITEKELQERVARALANRHQGNSSKVVYIPPDHLRVGDLVELSESEPIPGRKGCHRVQKIVGVTRIQKSGKRMKWTDTDNTAHDVDLERLQHLKVVQA